MNVLSLFDGISCGRVALQRIGIPVGNYYASEIDPHAIKIAKKNYPDTIHVGDVTTVKGKDLPQIDLILAGSPCQGFSHNGAKLGFDDPRSRLFWEFVRLVEECKPTWWLLENVRMKQDWSDIITGAVGYEPILINSALVSAQRRMRLYWTNIPQEGLPEDKGLVLKDILEKPVAEEIGRDQRTCVQVGLTESGGKFEQIRRDYSSNGKSPALTTCQGGGRQPKVLVVGQDREVNTYARMCNVYSPEGKAPTLLANAHGHNPKVLIRTPVDKMRVIKRENWRMLTPKECERLQTLPDDYTEGVSITQRYKALGNGWTVDVVAHLLQGMK